MRIEKRHKSVLLEIMEIVFTLFLIVIMVDNPRVAEIITAIALVLIYWELQRI